MSSDARRSRLTPRGRAVLAAVALGAVLATVGFVSGRGANEAAVAADPDAPVSDQPPATPTGSHRPDWRPAEPVAFTDGDTDAGGTLVRSAPVAVVVPDEPSGDELRVATWLGRRLLAPVLTTSEDLETLGTETLVLVGDATAVTSDLDLRRVTAPSPEPLVAPSAAGDPTTATASSVTTEQPTPALTGPPVADPVAELPGAANRRTPPAEVDLTDVEDLLADARGARSTRTVLAARPDGVTPTQVATAVALGHAVAVVDGDPRSDGDLIHARQLRGDGPVIAWGDGWDSPEASRHAELLAVIRAGNELPGGGYTLFPGRRMIALYGHPEGGALGLLGEQPPAEAVARTQSYVDSYAGLFDEPVIGAFDLITTVASAGAGPLGDYSRRTPIATLRPWVDAARDAGIYVVLDLQSGRTDFLTQAREYEELLLEPHVGLALDPEWRLGPTQRHLRQIGSVSGHEVNQVADYLAALTREHALPQKLLVVHQFKLTMIRDRDVIDTSHPELAVLIHMDGQGSQGAKNGTYATVTRDAPEGIWWGWKNFLDEDIPGVRSPEATAAVDPTPWFISYQ